MSALKEMKRFYYLLSVNGGVMATQYGSRIEQKTATTEWGWMFGIGLLIIILGLISFSFSIFATIVSVIFLGLLVLAAGLSEIAYAFANRKKDTFLHQLFIGILYSVSGFVLTLWPVTSAASLTLFLAVLLMVSGLFRVVDAAITRGAGWTWNAFGGALSILLGVLIMNRWPGSSLWILGLFIGLDLLFLGTGIINSSLKSRSTAQPLAG